MSGPGINRHLPVYEQVKLNRYHAITLFSAIGASVVYNVLTRKPRSSGMLRHGLALAGGYLAGEELSKFIEKRRKMRVLILEDYISRHPEDFPATEPKKYADVLMSWIPRR